jgi:RNA polymerase sigma-70 factor (ECF subfamily)
MFGFLSQNKKKKRFEIESMQYINQLFSAALRLTKNEAEAEDLVQDAYLRAYVFFDRFQPGTNLRAWLFKIMTNLFINKYRRKATENRILADEDHRLSMLSPGLVEYCKDPEAAFFDGLFGDDVKRALDDVNEDFRMVVLLADLHDFSYKEIAEILDCPVGTVMSRLFRGRRALQARLAEYAQARGIGVRAEESAQPSETEVSPESQAEPHRRAVGA